MKSVIFSAIIIPLKNPIKIFIQHIKTHFERYSLFRCSMSCFLYLLFSFQKTMKKLHEVQEIGRKIPRVTRIVPGVLPPARFPCGWCAIPSQGATLASRSSARLPSQWDAP